MITSFSKKKKENKEKIATLVNQGIIEWSKPRLENFNKLMAYYRCAIMEIETKLNVFIE